MKRREFIKNLGILSALFYAGYNESFRLNKYFFEEKEKEMFNSITKYIYKIKTEIKYVILTNDKEIDTIINAYGIIKNGKFYTVNHCVAMNAYQQVTPFGIVSLPTKTIETKTTLNNIPLKIILKDYEKDLAIFELPEYYNPPEIPGTFEDVKIGDKIYVIGNPILKGFNIREGRVSDNNGFEDQK
jgi:hypothetical protein